MKKMNLFLWCSFALYADSADPVHHYFWANYQQFRGNTKEAQAWYDSLLTNQRSSIYTNKGYLHFLHDSGDHKRIVELIPKLEKTFENDPDIQLIFAQALKKTGDVKQADNKIVKLAHQFTTHPEIVFQAAEVLVRNHQHENALLVIEDYLNSAPHRPNHFIFHFLKAQVHSQLGNYQLAKTSVQECLAIQPRFPQGWLLLALMEEQAGKLDDAIKGYSSYLEVAGSNQQIEQHLLRLAFKQKSLKNSYGMLAINKNCFDKAVLLYDRKQYAEALKQLDICLSQNPQDAKMRLLKVQILTALTKVDEAIHLLVQWSNAEKANPMWLQCLHLLPRAGNVPYEKIAQAFERITNNNPQEVLPVLYLADTFTRMDKKQKALDCHAKALGLTKEPQLKMRISYQIALIYYDLNQHEAMAKVLETAQELQVEYAPALNLLAYYYATDAHRYEKARALIDRALELDPHNPHFKDTKAVVLYKQHNYNESFALLKQLAQEVPHDSTVLIHLAKVHKKLGNDYQALSVLEHAQRHAHNDYEKKTSGNLLKEWTI